MKYRKVKYKRHEIEGVGRFHQFGKAPWGNETAVIVENDKGHLLFFRLKEITFVETPEGAPYPSEEITKEDDDFLN